MLILIEFVYHMAQLFTHQNAVRKNEEKYKGEVTMPEYIEREALKADLFKSVIFSCRTEDVPQLQKDLNKIVDCIDRQPTADVVELKHGRNITKMHPADEFICSECDFMCEDLTEKVYNENGDYFYHQAYECNYCPNCGAKMDKE
jgi:hypothetical protein